MRIFALLALSCWIGVSAQAAQEGPTPAAHAAPGSPVPANIDPAKEADIRHLLAVAGTLALAQQMMNTMEQSLRPVLLNSLPPGEYRGRLMDLFFEKFHSKFDSQQILDLAVVRYDENFSDDEIKGLINFYQTPLGHKVITVLPKMTAELQQDGQKLGQQVGRESMMEVLSEHPDIAQALQEASRRGASPNR